MAISEKMAKYPISFMAPLSRQLTVPSRYAHHKNLRELTTVSSGRGLHLLFGFVSILMTCAIGSSMTSSCRTSTATWLKSRCRFHKKSTLISLIVWFTETKIINHDDIRVPQPHWKFKVWFPTSCVPSLVAKPSGAAAARGNGYKPNLSPAIAKRAA